MLLGYTGGQALLSVPPLEPFFLGEFFHSFLKPLPGWILAEPVQPVLQTLQSGGFSRGSALQIEQRGASIAALIFCSFVTLMGFL